MTAEELAWLDAIPQVRRRIEEALTERNAYDVNLTPTKL
jgi:hypothetical protein